MAKARTAKLPKRIAGVKVPKGLRRSGARALQLLRHPLVADLLVAGVVAGVTAAGENRRLREAARTARDKIGKAARAIGAG